MTTLSPPPRRFVPEDLDAGALATLEPLFEQLLERDPGDAEALLEWLRDESELLAA